MGSSVYRDVFKNYRIGDIIMNGVLDYEDVQLKSLVSFVKWLSNHCPVSSLEKVMGYKEKELIETVV